MTAVTIRVSAPLRPFTGGQSKVAVEATTVRDALDRLGEDHTELVARIRDERGDVREFVNVFLGSTNVTELGGLEAEVRAGDVLTILPAVAGGAR